jgi:hypothetical protein
MVFKILDRITALAYAEQSLIGWTQAFKGRLSKQWTTAQGLWYDHMRHNLPASQKFPKRYTGPICMKQLFTQLIYYNLNRWQIRNEAAQATESAEEYRKTQEMHQSTITALYQSNSTDPDPDPDPDPHALYRQPLGDILNMSNERLVNWLRATRHHHHTEHTNITTNQHTSLKTFSKKTSINLYNTKQKDEIKLYF